MEEKDFKKHLTEEQYNVLRKGHTERPGTGKLLHNEKTGKYKCAACGNILFDSKHKFKSGTGWPSFYDLAKSGSVHIRRDDSLGMVRTEVVCAKCGSHLGHLFKDAPQTPTGNRYCINSLALDFEETGGKKKNG